MKKNVKNLCLLFVAAVVLLFCASTAPAAGLTPEEVVERIEQRYVNQGFTANFMQQSTIKALQITDFAEGRLTMYYPGRMRWEYLSPEQQLIVANVTKLWVYRPADNQVMTGDPRAFFSIGKGASFLSDITTMRKNFKISFDEQGAGNDYRLKLVPINQHADIAEILLTVTSADFRIYRVSTINHYGDTTDIELFDINFVKPPESDFDFVVPHGVDVVRLDN